MPLLNFCCLESMFSTSSTMISSQNAGVDECSVEYSLSCCKCCPREESIELRVKGNPSESGVKYESSRWILMLIDDNPETKHHSNTTSRKATDCSLYLILKNNKFPTNNA